MLIDAVNALNAAVKGLDALGRESLRLRTGEHGRQGTPVLRRPVHRRPKAVVEGRGQAAHLRGERSERLRAEQPDRLRVDPHDHDAVVTGAVVLGIAMALWMAITISRGLSKAVSAAQSVAAGDLTGTWP